MNMTCSVDKDRHNLPQKPGDAQFRFEKWIMDTKDEYNLW